jgi:hypothetical protein
MQETFCALLATINHLRVDLVVIKSHGDGWPDLLDQLRAEI